MAEHTPGPWHVNGLDTIMSTKGNRSIAKVYHPELDGRLIAAAPTLLEAGTELLEVADMRGDSTLPAPEDDAGLWTARMQTAWDEFRTAIEEAEHD
jgi:hypothetical protein